MGSESFSASERISEAFLALRPPGSRMVAKTVWPLRASVSTKSLPKPVLEPVMRTTCFDLIIILLVAVRFDARCKAVGYNNEFNRLPRVRNACGQGDPSLGVRGGRMRSHPSRFSRWVWRRRRD